MLVVCIARPELLDAAARLGRREAQRDDDSPRAALRRDGATAARQSPRRHVAPGEVRDRITAAAEGIPLFVEEMVSMLVDSGRLRRTDGGWQVDGDLAGMAVPPTIRALLAARLDGLPDDERRILEAAAVVGKEFWRGRGRGARSRPTCGPVRERCSPSCCARISSFPSSRPSVATTGSGSATSSSVTPPTTPCRRRRGPRCTNGSRRGSATSSRAGPPRWRRSSAITSRRRIETGSPSVLPTIAARVLARRAATHLLASGRRALDRNDYRGAVNLLERAHVLTESPDAELLIAYSSALAHSGVLVRALDVVRSAIDDGRASG